MFAWISKHATAFTEVTISSWRDNATYHILDIILMKRVVNHSKKLNKNGKNLNK